MSPVRGFYCKCKSQFDSAPLIVMYILNSSNRKTGPEMIQTYILREDQSPTEASNSKNDKSICGQCPLRWSLGGSCYVNLGWGPFNIFKAYKNGAYEELNLKNSDHMKYLKNRPIRLGAYGDPAAVPLKIWKNYFSCCNPRYWNGFTHAWKLKRVQPYKPFLMASTESESEYFEAINTGWRSFRVRQADEPLLPLEFQCPASEEEGYRLQCQDCKACNGNPNSRGRAGNPVIIEHGFKAPKKVPKYASSSTQ